MNLENQPLISVIVPVYKVEKYLHRCVDSILNQTYRNLEIILVDDGSPDNCGTICDEYAAKDSRIRVIHQENAGVSAARNAGLDACTGEYVAFVDSDDYIMPEMYETMLSALLEKNVDICVCQWQYEYADGRHPITQKHIDQTIYNVKTSRELIRYVYKSIYDVFTTIIAVNKLYKRSIICNERFQGRRMEDDTLHTRLFVKNIPVVVIRDLLYVYYENTSSLTRASFGQEHIKFLDLLLERYHLYGDDPFMKHESLVRYADIYIEYYFKAKLLRLTMPKKSNFMFAVWKLICERSCSIKFYVRMLVFAVSPALYQCIVRQKHQG